jgi:hypothetical protein
MQFGYLNIAAPGRKDALAFMFNWTGHLTAQPGLEKDYMEGHGSSAFVRVHPGEDALPGEQVRAVPLVTTINVSHEHPYVIVGTKSEFRHLGERAHSQQINIDPGSLVCPIQDDRRPTTSTGSPQEQTLLFQRGLEKQRGMRDLRTQMHRSGLFFRVTKLEKEMKEHVKDAALDLAGMMNSVAGVMMQSPATDVVTHAAPIVGEAVGKTKYQLTLFLQPADLIGAREPGGVIKVDDPITLGALLQAAFHYWPKFHL